MTKRHYRTIPYVFKIHTSAKTKGVPTSNNTSKLPASFSNYERFSKDNFIKNWIWKQLHETCSRLPGTSEFTRCRIIFVQRSYDWWRDCNGRHLIINRYPWWSRSVTCQQMSQRSETGVDTRRVSCDTAWQQLQLNNRCGQQDVRSTWYQLAIQATRHICRKKRLSELCALNNKNMYLS